MQGNAAVISVAGGHDSFVFFLLVSDKIIEN